jgi:hypothetical protein
MGLSRSMDTHDSHINVVQYCSQFVTSKLLLAPKGFVGARLGSTPIRYFACTIATKTFL